MSSDHSVRTRARRLFRRAIPGGARVLALMAGLGVGPIRSAVLEAQVASPAPADSNRYSLGTGSDTAGRDPRELDAAGQRYAAAVRNCYEEGGLKEDPTLSGLLRVEMTVLPAGDVRAATATATRVHGLGMSAVTACVSTAARSWRFGSGASRAERVVLWFDLLPPAS